MQFNSLQYLIFLPLIVIVYYLLKPKYRWVLLLAGSYYFYMCWRVEYIILILASTAIDYFCGLQMSKIRERSKRVPYLILSLVANLGLLFAFKYFNFAVDTSNIILEKLNIAKQLPGLKVLLPVGISFYTFQTLSYTIEVYLDRAKAEKHLGYFALYVSFFPQLVAGPIERYTRLSPQLKKEHVLSYENLSNGFRLILFGLFIKMVIADNLSVFVDKIYTAPEQYNSWSIITGMVFYSFQIYSDFFGYSTIAIGSAKLLGIDLMDNFRTPYLARNIGEFWQRWHISLSTWFRDYLYIPMGGNRVKWFRWAVNIMIVFTVSGLWHGANWTFVIWGAIFGFAYLVERVWTKIGKLSSKDAIFNAWHILLAVKTFVLVTIAWIFFRSRDLAHAKAMFSNVYNNFGLDRKLEVPAYVWVFFGVFVLLDLWLYNSRFDIKIGKFSFPVRWLSYAILLFGIIFYCGVEDFPFIYFQF
ncbi:MAG: MBOAT family protein [Bacteroidales bacterium]|nr:MBOAT family protein [Bacteroidales bacterium]